MLISSTEIEYNDGIKTTTTFLFITSQIRTFKIADYFKLQIISLRILFNCCS